MRTTSRLLGSLVLVFLVGLPIFTISADAFDGEFVLEAELSFFGDWRYMYVSPDGELICIATEDEISIVDVETHTIIVKQTFSDLIGRGCWAGDAIYVEMSRPDGGPNYVKYLVVLNPDDLSEVTAFKPPRSSIHNLAASPTGDYIALTTRHPSRQWPEVYVLRTSDNEVEYSFQDDKTDAHGWLAWSPDGNQLATVSDERVYIHDIGAGTNTDFSKRTTRTENLIFTSDGTKLYSFNHGGDVDLYDLDNKQLMSTETLSSSLDCADIDFIRDAFCIGEWADLRVYSLETFDHLEIHSDAGDDITQVEWLVGGQRIVTISEDGFLRFYRDTTDPTWNTPPVITIVSPTWGQEVANNFNASGTITDDGTSFVGSFSINRGPWTPLDEPDAWSIEVFVGHLIHGSNQLTISASDGEIETTETVFFLYIGEPIPNAHPTVEILSPTDGSEVGEVFTITGSATDDIAVKSVHVSLADGPWTRASGTDEWSYLAIVPPAILDSLTIRAKASDGSMESLVITIDLFVNRSGTTDNRPPRVILERPLDGALVTDTLECRGTTEDDGDVLMTFVSFDGGTWSILSTAISWIRSFPTNDWSVGTHNVSFMAFDGDLSSQVITVSVTRYIYNIPVVQITEPAAGERFSDPLVVSGTAFASRGDIIRVEVRVAGDVWTTAEFNETWTYLLDPEGLSLGNLMVEVRAWDERTNSTIASVDVVYEGEEPRGGEDNDWLVWLIILILILVIAVFFLFRRGGNRKNEPAGIRTNVMLVLAILISLILLQGLVGGANGQDYDFEIVKEVQGIRGSPHMFPSPDLGNICIVNRSWEPPGNVVRIYNFTVDRFVAELRLPSYSIQDGCWVGNRIILALYPSDEFMDIDPILVLSASDLSTISIEDPDDTDSLYNFRGLLVSPSGDRIATRGSEILVLDSSDFEVLHHFKDDYRHINAMAWSPDGERLVVVGNSIWIYDLEKNTSTRTQNYYIGYRDVFWSSNGSWLYIMISGNARIYDIAADEFIQEEFLGHGMRCWWPNLVTDEMIWGDDTELGISKLEDLSLVTKFEAAVERVEMVIWDHKESRIVVMTDKGVIRIFLDANIKSDNQPPHIVILRPFEGEEIVGDFVAEGTITDDEQIIYAQLKINDGEWSNLNNPIFWRLNIILDDLVEGDNVLSISASDGEHLSTESVTFHVAPEILQNEPPSVSITSPEEGNEVGPLIEVMGIAIDDQNVGMTLVRFGNGKWSIAEGTSEWSAILTIPRSWAAGPITIEAKAWDGTTFSDIDVVNVTFKFDDPSPNDRPIVVIGSPSEGDLLFDDVYLIGETEDDSSMITTLISIDGGPLETFTTDMVWEKDLTHLGPGEHSVSVIASDGLLVSEMETVNFTLVDYASIRVVITSPDDGMDVIDDVLVSGVILGGYGALRSVDIRLDDGEWSEVGFERSWHVWISLIDETVGEHRIEVRASDSYGSPYVANITVNLVPEMDNPTEPREPNSIYFWIIAVVVVAFIVAVWQAKRKPST